MPFEDIFILVRLLVFLITVCLSVFDFVLLILAVLGTALDFHFSYLISLSRMQTWVLDRRWKFMAADYCFGHFT